MVGGTSAPTAELALAGRFSALSRAVVGGTSRELIAHHFSLPFQCSQSSRGWWNGVVSAMIMQAISVSVLSVEPWLVEPVSAII